MKKWYGALAGFAMAVLMVSAGVAPVLAHESNETDSSGRRGGDRASTVVHRETGEGEHLEDEDANEDHPKAMQIAMMAENRQRLRERAEDALAKEKAEHQTRTAEERAQRCQVVKNGLQNKVDRLASNGQKHLAHIDGVLAKAQQYQTANNLNSDDLDAKLAAAKSAQTDATEAVAALKELKPTVACNKDSVASDVATFREAAAEARTQLQTYRKAVKTLLVALKDAKPASTTEAGNE